MKTRSKALLLVLCAVLLVTASVLGTMAYLTDSQTVTNTFSVGNVTITLDEAKVDPNTGAADSTAPRQTTNSYKLMPGHSYTKDPIIHVDANSEDCFLFVKITNDIAAIEDTNNTVANQMASKGWAAVNGQPGVYVYIGTDTGASAPLAVTKGSNIPVFEKIVIKGDVNNTTLAGYKDKTIVVEAYAVQKDGFETKGASEIWTTAFGA